MTRLDEYDKAEWWDVARKLNPKITEDEYGAMWLEMRELKQARLQEAAQ